MDIITKIFLINWVLLLSMAFIDGRYIGDKRLNGELVVTSIIWWENTSIFTSPIFIIYKIVT